MTGRADAGDDLDTRVRRRYQSEPGRDDPVSRIQELLVAEAPLLGRAELAERTRRLSAELVGLGRLQLLLDQPDVTDVLVNGPGEIWVERAGSVQPSGEHIDRAGIDRAIERLVGPLGLRADRAHPIVDARLRDGTRVSVVLRPLAVDGPVMAIRRHRERSVPLDAFAGPEVVDRLLEAIAERANVVVFGSTGSGKTTLLNALCAHVPTAERIITIEDVAELRLPGEHVVRLEARPGSAEGVGRTGIRELVRAALRLRPDRIIVGEVRGAEAVDMVWALSTGHEGSMSTLHARSAADALRRLETMCLLGAEGQLPLDAVREQVRSAVDLLVGVRRAPDGRRRVVELLPVRADRFDGATR